MDTNTPNEAPIRASWGEEPKSISGQKRTSAVGIIFYKEQESLEGPKFGVFFFRPHHAKGNGNYFIASDKTCIKIKAYTVAFQFHSVAQASASDWWKKNDRQGKLIEWRKLSRN